LRLISAIDYMTADREYLMEYLSRMNYWWHASGVREEDKGIARSGYVDKIKDTIGLERIVCVSGVRRSGKSTLLFQFIDYLIESSVPPENIVLVRVDDLIGKTDDLRDVVSVFHELKGIDPREKEVYFLLDEVHFMENWHLQLKHFIDLRYKSRFIVTGSSKTLVYKDASESLAGRVRFIDVFPLTFKEFLSFSGHDVKPEEDRDKLYYSLVGKKEDLANKLRDYVEVGGFPEWFKIKDRHRWARVLVEDYLSLILFKDIVHVFRIKDPILLEKLAHEVAAFTTERFSYTKLAQRLDTDRETVKLYLYYLESAGLISVAEVYFPKKKARERMEKKLYFWEEGMRRALTLDANDSRSIENMVAHRLTVMGMEGKPFFKPYYWKNSHEVDYILDTGKAVVPVETKYRSDPYDVHGILEFMERHDVRKGYIVTKDTYDARTYDGRVVTFIPAWFFLLLDALV